MLFSQDVYHINWLAVFVHQQYEQKLPRSQEWVVSNNLPKSLRGYPFYQRIYQLVIRSRTSLLLPTFDQKVSLPLSLFYRFHAILIRIFPRTKSLLYKNSICICLFVCLGICVVALWREQSWFSSWNPHPLRPNVAHLPRALKKLLRLIHPWLGFGKLLGSLFGSLKLKMQECV